MEDHAQKMEALKKAYAEIILNTAKEAAVRAMASERKALRLHHDLRNTKDEALRMLLRFKQMIDVKTAEAETTASSKQNRINELDAQLNETEGVIMDLRADIRKAHERLEEMKNSHMLQSDVPSENDHIHPQDTDVTQQFRCSSPFSKSCNPEIEITTSDPNLASIIIDKEPDLYRNGYTHRIRAIERNPLDEKKFPEADESVIEKLNLKKKSCGNDAKLTETNENNAGTLRRSVRKRKVRCWDEISSLFKSRASTKHADTKLLNDLVDEKHESAAEETAGTVRDAGNNKCLKYTFSRRQKKVLPSESYNCSSLGKSSLTGQMREKPSYSLENEKSNLFDDSSSDSQNIIDVACQLISLSGERSR